MPALRERLRWWGRSMVRFARREDGPTAVEYSVLLALILMVCMASIKALGPAVLATFSNSATTVGTHGVP